MEVPFRLAEFGGGPGVKGVRALALHMLLGGHREADAEIALAEGRDLVIAPRFLMGEIALGTPTITSPLSL